MSNFNVATATPITLNRAVLVTDSSNLVDTSGSPTVYTTLGLTADDVVVEESEETLIYDAIISGKENLVARLQGEFAYNLKVKGYAWKVAAGVNPDDATVGAIAPSPVSWVGKLNDVKSTAGVALLTK